MRVIDPGHSYELDSLDGEHELYRVATRLGVDLHAEIDRKMAVNRARTWKLDGSGCGYHVKPGEAGHE